MGDFSQGFSTVEEERNFLIQGLDEELKKTKDEEGKGP